MVKIVVGGQLAKEEIAAQAKKVGGDQVQVTVKGDVQGAMDIASGAADFYLGACQTGGGGSLSMAIAMCGYGRCLTVASPGKLMNEQDMINAVKSGKKCFGMVVEAIPTVVPVLVKEMIAQKG